MDHFMLFHINFKGTFVITLKATEKFTTWVFFRVHVLANHLLGIELHSVCSLMSLINETQREMYLIDISRKGDNLCELKLFVKHVDVRGDLQQTQ